MAYEYTGYQTVPQPGVVLGNNRYLYMPDINKCRSVLRIGLG
jgi:hypothetical protein